MTGSAARILAHRVLHLSVADGSHRLGLVEDPRIVGPIDFAWRLADRGRDVTVLGVGPLPPAVVPGASRLIVCGRSPAVGSFHVSTLGGAAIPWAALGIRFLVLSGRARRPSVLALTRRSGKLAARVVPVDPEPLWAGFDGEVGVYALMRWVLARFGDGCPSARALCMGPAAARTRAAAIGSAPVVEGRLSSVDTWAARGGLGSRLYQEHHLAAIIYGGDAVPMAALDFGEPRSAGAALLATHGTFGTNFRTLGERALSFNYQSVLWAEPVRDRISERLIAGHYLRQYDEDGKRRGPGHTCGEPCGIACKKLDGVHKKDYEPYQALGPLVGVFDQRAAESLNRLTDCAGFDAIEIGGQVAWVMECLERGLLGEEETGIAERPAWDPERFDPIAGSAHNARLASRVVAWILDDPRAASLRLGLRTAARAIGGAAGEAAVYAAAGDDGCLVPSQYWVPGVLAPVPVLGRYYLDYSYEWQPPRELGRSCAARMSRELMLDNLGMCRFHRAWAEELLPEVLRRVSGVALDLHEHHRLLARELDETSPARPWETERVVDLVRTYLEKVRADGPRDAALDAWVDRFGRDARGAARAYWEEIRAGVAEGVRGQATCA